MANAIGKLVALVRHSGAGQYGQMCTSPSGFLKPQGPRREGGELFRVQGGTEQPSV